MPCRRKEAAAVEITALAAGAGPPAKTMATRRIGRWPGAGFGEVEAEGMEGRLPFGSRVSSIDPVEPTDYGGFSLRHVARIIHHVCCIHPQAVGAAQERPQYRQH